MTSIQYATMATANAERATGEVDLKEIVNQVSGLFGKGT